MPDGCILPIRQGFHSRQRIMSKQYFAAIASSTAKPAPCSTGWVDMHVRLWAAELEGQAIF
jgi:hypothetical protein